MDREATQDEIDVKNRAFWSELCGSSLAKHLGVVDSSIESLTKFDNYYMDYYPYLRNYLPVENMTGKKVLEVGLGYGTVGQYIASHGADYHGLDISQNAVDMTNHRLRQNRLEGQAIVGSVLNSNFPDNYFDYVISIGCFHHTGNMQKCIDETYRMLKPGGQAIIMVYNKFSLRQWAKWPVQTAKNLILQKSNQIKATKTSSKQRKAYDATSDKKIGAPETEFYSVNDINKIFSIFEQVKTTRENFDDYFLSFGISRIHLFGFGPRIKYLDSKLVSQFGLDLYIQAIK